MVLGMDFENHHLVDLIKKRQAATPMRDFAPTLGVTAAYLYDVYRGNRPVGPRLAKALGYMAIRKTHVTFRRVRK